VPAGGGLPISPSAGRWPNASIAHSSAIVPPMTSFAATGSGRFSMTRGDRVEGCRLGEPATKR
jgi:hypothetical protein